MIALASLQAANGMRLMGSLDRRDAALLVACRAAQAYSTRNPEIARAMTRRWISEVPSKIV
jgi:hypothetical protein